MFRNGGPLRNYERWKYGEHVIETVSYYKYDREFLGTLVKRHWLNQPSKALFAVKSRLTQFGNVYLSVIFKIFDTKILPVLLYGSEIWFRHPSMAVEKVHNQFCKSVLRLPIYATNVFARRELVRYKLEVFKYLKAIKYWLRVLSLSGCRIPKLCYKMQRRWVVNDTECWLFHIRNLLFSSGFGEAWLNQGVGNKRAFLKLFKQRPMDMDMQSLNMDIQDVDRLCTYKILKVRFGTEGYLFDIKNTILRTLFSKFRGSTLLTIYTVNRNHTYNIK